MKFPLLILLTAFATSAGSVAADERLPEVFHFPRHVTSETLDMSVALEDGKRPERYQGKLQIDGVKTEIMWPEYPPAAYKLNDRFYLIYDGYDTSRGFMWNAAERTIAPLGQITIGADSKFGQLIWRYDRSKDLDRELLHFDPKTGEPMVLYRDQPLGSKIGEYEGGIVLANGAGKLVVLKPGQPASKLKIDTRGRVYGGGHDAIRGNKLLLMEGYSGKRFLVGSFSGNLFGYDVAAAILDLKTGEIKDLGSFAGGWTTHTAVPHASYGVSWVTKEQARDLSKLRIAILQKTFGGGWGYVVEETETLMEFETAE